MKRLISFIMILLLSINNIPLQVLATENADRGTESVYEETVAIDETEDSTEETTTPIVDSTEEIKAPENSTEEATSPVVDSTEVIKGPEDSTEEVTTTVEFTEKITETSNISLGGDDNDELFAGYAGKLFGITDFETMAPGSPADGSKRKAAVLRRKSLEGTDALIYDTIANALPDILSGTVTSMVFTVPLESLTFTPDDLGVSAIFVDGKVSSDAQTAAVEKMKNTYSYTPKIILQALLADYPYDLFWYDKTKESKFGMGKFTLSAQSTEGNETITLMNLAITVSLPVVSEFAGVGDYVVGSGTITSVSTAAENAQNIVNQHANLSDYEKLVSYKDEICALTSYNHDAASDTYSGGYGNPWQLIWVFDNDTETKVVCEGYSKAFKYLCDLSGFVSEDISCYLVSGTMSGGTGEGRHMWNIVKMDDGKNYLADITNSDEGTAGSEGQLFLKGWYNHEDDTYTYNYSTNAATEYLINYKYDEKMHLIFDDELVLSDTDYVEINNPSLDIEFIHSCSFGNNLTINYYIPTASLEGYDNYRLELNKQVFDETGSSYNWATSEITTCSDRTNEGTDYKVFSFRGIAAKEMGDEVHAILYAEKDGVTYQSKEDTYSIKTYAFNRLEASSDVYFKHLLVDMLNYGGNAQTYFKYNTSHPVNADLTEQQQSYVSAMPELESKERITSTDGATAHYYGKSVVLGNNVELKYYMTFDTGAPGDNVKLELVYTAIDGTEYSTTVPASEFVYTDEYHAYGAKLTTIAAKDMSSIVTARIYDGDTLISDELEYSIETYAYNRLRDSTDEGFKSLVSEMMKYGKSAETYFRNKQ